MPSHSSFTLSSSKKCSILRALSSLAVLFFRPIPCLLLIYNEYVHNFSEQSCCLCKRIVLFSFIFSNSFDLYHLTPLVQDLCYFFCMITVHTLVHIFPAWPALPTLSFYHMIWAVCVFRSRSLLNDLLQSVQIIFLHSHSWAILFILYLASSHI